MADLGSFLWLLASVMLASVLVLWLLLFALVAVGVHRDRG